MTTTRVASLVALTGVALTMGARPSAADHAQLVNAYNSIKALESKFPLPQPRGQVNVGTFDAATKQFTGLVSTSQVIFDPILHKPHVIWIPPTAQVNAVAITLRFTAQNGPATITVTPTFGTHGPGPTSTLQLAYGATGTVDVGRATQVAWSANGAGGTYSDRLIIARPKIVGAGAFIIPALPVAVVYEPPAVGSGTSRQTYTEEYTVGTTVRTEFTQENSTTTPGSPSRFAIALDMKSQMSALGTLLQNSGTVDPTGTLKIAGQALSAIAGAVGSATASNTDDTVHTVVSEQQLKVTLKHAVSSNSNLGPGKGDIIYYLINARLVWLVEDGDLTLALLGFDGLGGKSVQDLQAHPELAGVDAATVQELLKLDPFVAGGPQSAPPSPRFTYEHFLSLSHILDVFTESHEVTQTDLIATTNSQIRTEDYREGFLSFLGIGVDATKQVTTKITHSNSTAVSVGHTTTVELTLNVVENAEFNVYFDRVFGTFALTIRRPLKNLGDIFVNPGNLVFAR